MCRFDWIRYITIKLLALLCISAEGVSAVETIQKQFYIIKGGTSLVECNIILFQRPTIRPQHPSYVSPPAMKSCNRPMVQDNSGIYRLSASEIVYLLKFCTL